MIWGDYNIRAEELEASGILKALGLTLVKADNSSTTCTSGKGSCIDYALVTSGFTEAIVDMKAVKVVPWGPHYGLRIRFRTNLKDLTIPEIKRPMPMEEAVKELEKLGLTESSDDGKPKITWEEAKRITRKIVDKARKRENQPGVEEYAAEIGIDTSMRKATWQYAEWSAAAELRLLSANGVKAKWMTNKQIEKYCGRGLPWEVRQNLFAEAKNKTMLKNKLGS